MKITSANGLGSAYNICYTEIGMPIADGMSELA
jgi:hypothetical protein